MKTPGFIYIILVTLGTITKAQTVTGEPAGIPRVPQVYQTEPWEDPQITSINLAKMEKWGCHRVDPAHGCAAH
jgi:beta-galactosidase